jgi:hypothetical protein
VDEGILLVVSPVERPGVHVVIGRQGLADTENRTSDADERYEQRCGIAGFDHPKKAARTFHELSYLSRKRQTASTLAQLPPASTLSSEQ